MISSHVGPSYGGYSAQDAIPKIEEVKHQSGNR